MYNVSYYLFQKVLCPDCKMDDIDRFVKAQAGIQRFLCKRRECPISTFMLECQNEGCKPGISMEIIDMAINGSGIRDTARVLSIRKGTVIPIPFSNYEMTAHEREYRLFSRPTSDSKLFHASQHLLIISS